MHRFLVDAALLSEESPVLPSDAAKHLRVVRPKEGEVVELFDGRGGSRTYRFSASSANGASPLSATSQTSQTPRAPRTLTLFACVTKGSRWDWTLEKATELGVTRIVPVLSDRTIVRIPKAERAAKRERWMRIAEDAARQSDAKWLPEITEAVDFRDSLPLVRETTCYIGALTNPPSPLLAEALRERPQSAHLAAYVGPEGDFTPEELSALMEIAVPVSFGPTVLRAETAAIFVLSVLSAMSGR